MMPSSTVACAPAVSECPDELESPFLVRELALIRNRSPLLLSANSDTLFPEPSRTEPDLLRRIIFWPNDQTSLLAFINGGATASYGTVVEPCNYLEKFPSPQVYFYQSRGFTVG